MSKIVSRDKNLYIENKNPHRFEKLAIETGKILTDGREVVCGRDIYACLYCEKLKNITFIVRGEEVKVSSFIFDDEDGFQMFLTMIRKELPEILMSEQNRKITGYAFAVAEKLRIGIETTIIASKDEETVSCCPVCGMQCDPNIPYCMECGSEV